MNEEKINLISVKLYTEYYKNNIEDRYIRNYSKNNMEDMKNAYLRKFGFYRGIKFEFGYLIESGF